MVCDTRHAPDEVLKKRRSPTDPEGMARHSVSFYICAGFLAVFGFLGLGSYDPGTAKIELVLAVVVLAAGLYLHSGAANGRNVGLVVLVGVIGFGAVQLFGGSYVPGTIVAAIALFRLASAQQVSAQAPTGGFPQQSYGAPTTYPQPQPYGVPQQQMYYGQQPLGQPAPYGAAPPPPPTPQPPPMVGDPRFGVPMPPPQAAQPVPPAQPGS